MDVDSSSVSVERSVLYDACRDGGGWSGDGGV
jgi:hypothetical protein